MNNKGFTLVEVIVCVAILALISTIATVGISNYLKTNEIKEYEMIEKDLKSNLELYNLDFEEVLWNGNSYIDVSLEDLKKANPNFSLSSSCVVSYMKVVKGSASYDYKTCIKCGKDFNTYISGDC